MVSCDAPGNVHRNVMRNGVHILRIALVAGKSSNTVSHGRLECLLISNVATALCRDVQLAPAKSSMNILGGRAGRGRLFFPSPPPQKEP